MRDLPADREAFWVNELFVLMEKPELYDGNMLAIITHVSDQQKGFARDDWGVAVCVAAGGIPWTRAVPSLV
jgi:hypothetical protein